MIRLTERAAHGLREILTTNRAPRDQGVKLVPDERGAITMTIDKPGEGDSVVDGGQRPLLIVDAMIAERLDGVVLDFARGEDGETPRFVLRGPESAAPPS
jgi:Fe-S cluster assembly iron-binding protein IscA